MNQEIQIFGLYYLKINNKKMKSIFKKDQILIKIKKLNKTLKKDKKNTDNKNLKKCFQTQWF